MLAAYSRRLGDGLRGEALRGGIWMGGGSVAEQAMRFARNVVLARILAPEAFGTMAIVLSCSSLLGGLTDVGLKAAIIQNRRGTEESYLNVYWWLGLGRGICLYAVIFVTAPWISRFYGMVDLSTLLRVALLSTLFESAMSPRSILPQKEMKFARWAAITNGGAILGVIVTVALSLWIRDVWALVIGSCSENAFRLLLSYILCPGLPRFGWDREAASDLLKFSRGVFGLSLLNLIFARADVFVLAKLASPTQLGLYTMAVYVVQTPCSFVIALLSQTLLPALSRVQHDVQRVNSILIEVTSWSVTLGLPAVALICACAPSILTLVYGASYATAAGALAFAAAVSFLNTLNSLITSVLYAGGRPGLHRRAVAASAVVMVLAVYPSCKAFGLVGGQVSALFAIAISYYLQVVRIRETTNLSLRRYGRAFVPGIVAAMVVACGLLAARVFGIAMGPVVNIAVAVGCYAAAYLVLAIRPHVATRVAAFTRN